MSLNLSYDYQTHRRCLCCKAKKGQYPLRRIFAQNGRVEFVVLECGHVAASHNDFVASRKPLRW